MDLCTALALNFVCLFIYFEKERAKRVGAERWGRERIPSTLCTVREVGCWTNWATHVSCIVLALYHNACEISSYIKIWCHQRNAVESSVENINSGAISLHGVQISYDQVLLCFPNNLKFLWCPLSSLQHAQVTWVGRWGAVVLQNRSDNIGEQK